MLPWTSDATPSITGTAAASISSVTPLAAATSHAWPISPKPGDVRAGMDGIRRQGLQDFAGAAIEPDHRRHGRRDQRLRRAPDLQRRRDDAGAERLGQKQHVARTGAGVAPDAIRVHLAGHGVAELDLLILDGVPAEQR